MRVMVLGAAGNAGANYIKCLKMYHGSNVEVVAVDENELQLKALDRADEKFWAQRRLTPQSIENLAKLYKADFVHAQPDSLVHMLLMSNVPQTPKSEVQYLNFSIKTFYTGKVAFLSKIKKADFEQMLWDSEDGYVWIRSSTGAGSKGALKCSSWKQAKAWEKVWEEKGEHFLAVWPYLPGEDVALQTFYHDGELVHAGARKRLQYAGANQSINGSTSSASVSETIATPFEAIELIDNLQFREEFHGTYNWDFKRDQDGKLQLTECNYGRYFTTVDFMAACGLNTPGIELEVFRGGSYGKLLTVTPGLRWIRQMDRPPALENSRGTRYV